MSLLLVRNFGIVKSSLSSQQVSQSEWYAAEIVLQELYESDMVSYLSYLHLGLCSVSPGMAVKVTGFVEQAVEREGLGETEGSEVYFCAPSATYAPW